MEARGFITLCLMMLLTKSSWTAFLKTDKEPRIFGHHCGMLGTEMKYYIPLAAIEPDRLVVIDVNPPRA